MSSSNFFPISSLRNDANESSDALSSSSEEKGEVYQKLHKKVSNFVIVKKRKEALEKEQSELKKCLAKLEEYRKKNKLLDFQRKAFFDVFSLHDDADINQVNNKAQEAKNKISLLNSISNELDISQTEVFNPNEIYSKFISLKDISNNVDKFFSKFFRILGIFPNEENSKINNELLETKSDMLLNAIKKLKEQSENYKNDNEVTTKQIDELCKILNIDENDFYTKQFRLKEAVKSLKNKYDKEISEIANILSVDQSSTTEIETPELVKNAINDLLKTQNTNHQKLFENEQKLEQISSQIVNLEERYEKMAKKVNCSTIEEAIENLQSLFVLFNVNTPDLLRLSIRQMKDQNKQLYTTNSELTSNLNLLSINSQTVSDQLRSTQEQLRNVKSQFNETEAKKQALKSDVKELKSKLNSIGTELKAKIIENNSIHGQLSDKDEEIIALKTLLNSEKGNVQIHFDEMEDQILSLKSELRKVKIDYEAAKNDFSDLKQSTSTLQEQRDLLNKEKKELELENNQMQIQIKQLNNEIMNLTDDLENSKSMNENLKQKNSNLNNQIEEFEIEISKFRHLQNDLQQENSILNSNIEKLDNERKNLKNEIFELQNNISDLSRDLKTSKQENEKLSNDFEKSLNENREIKQENESNKLLISQLQNENVQIKNENSNQRTEIENLVLIKNELTNQNHEQKHNIIHLNEKVSDLESLNRTCMKKSEQLQSEIEELNHDNQILQNQISSIKQENNKLKQESEQIKEESEQIKEESEQIKEESEKKLKKLSENVETLEKEKQKLEKNYQENLITIEEIKEKIQKLSEENSNLSNQVSVFHQENIKLKNVNTENENLLSEIVTKLKLSSNKEIESKIAEIQQQNENYKKEIEENNQKISLMYDEKSSICKLLGITPSSQIADSISELLNDNKNMYSNNQTMKQQITKIAHLLNVDSNNYESIEDRIHELHEEITQKEIAIKSNSRELSNNTNLNKRLFQTMNVSDTESLIHAISSVQATLNKIKHILNVSEENLIDEVESIQNSIQSLCDALNIDPNDWCESVLMMHEALQDAAIILKLTNSEQLGPSVQSLLNERNHFKHIVDSIFAELHGQEKNQENQEIHENLVHEIRDILQKDSEMCVLLNDYKNKEDEICSLLNIPKLISTNHFDRIKTAIMNSNQDVDDLQKYIEKIKSHNDDLQNENNQEIQKYDDLASKYEDLKMKMNEIQIQNDDLIHQNNIFLADSKNNAALSQLLSEICQLLKIKPQFSKLDRNSKISNTISDAIENLQLANDEFIEFKNKVHSILKSNDINSTLSKIEHFSQVINELLRLFQAKSTENLIERAKENQKIIHQMSPLMNIFLNSFDNSNLNSFSLGNQNIDEHSKWEQVVKEIIKMKQNNDKLNSLFDSNDFVKTMNSIKRMQNHIKSQEKQIQIFEQFEDFVLREFDLHIDSNDQNNFQYQSIKSKITEWKNTNSQFKEIVDMLCKIFDCDPEFICDYVNLMNQTFRRLTKVFNISQKVPAVFSTIEKSINLMKEQNDSLLKKYNEDYLFISNCLPETDLHEQKSQDFIRFSFTKLNNLNTTLKNENNELKKRQIHNDSILVELEDQVQEFNNQNSKLIGLLQLDYDCSFREVLKRIEILNKTEKEFNKLIESHKANSTKTKVYEEKIVNHINAIKQTRNQISSPEEALKLMEKHENHIQRIRDKIGIQNSQFSFVVDKIFSVVDLLNSESKSNKKNEYELQSCKNRINDLLSIEKQYSNLFKSQEEKIEELSNEIEQSKLNSQHLTISLYDVFNTLGENVTSTEMAIELIEKLKTQISLLENEISAFKSGTTVDLAFKEMSNKDKKQLKLIKHKIFEQTEYFNSVILKILHQLETRNHNKEEIVRILKEAEIDNYRLLELLDPSIQPNQSKPIPSDSKTTGASFPSKPIHQQQNKMKIHIGNEFSMNPFQKQSADLFIQRENLIQQPNKKIIDGTIQSIKTKIHRKQKKISLAETSFEKQNFHNNIENRIKIKQTTLL